METSYNESYFTIFTVGLSSTPLGTQIHNHSNILPKLFFFPSCKGGKEKKDKKNAYLIGYMTFSVFCFKTLCLSSFISN